MQLLGIRSKVTHPAAGINSSHLPAINSFISVIVPGERVQSMPVDEINTKHLTTRAMKNAQVGQSAIFDYENGAGHFRFTGVCTEAGKTRTVFAVPPQIVEKQSFSQQPFQLTSIVDMKWRYAPSGVGYGELKADTLTSLGCEGATFVLPRDLREGTLLEIHISMDTKSAPCVRLAKLLRTKKVSINAGGKVVEKFQGEIEFLKSTPRDERLILDFLTARHSKFKQRSIAA